MLYYFFRFLEQFGIPGSGMWTYISFRSLLALILALAISAWFGGIYLFEIVGVKICVHGLRHSADKHIES